MRTTPIEKCAIGPEAEYDVKIATERGWSKFEIFPNGNLIGTSPTGETEAPVPRFRRMLNDAAPDLLAAIENYLTWFDDDSKTNQEVKEWLDDEGVPSMRKALARTKGITE